MLTTVIVISPSVDNPYINPDKHIPTHIPQVDPEEIVEVPDPKDIPFEVDFPDVEEIPDTDVEWFREIPKEFPGPDGSPDVPAEFPGPDGIPQEIQDPLGPPKPDWGWEIFPDTPEQMPWPVITEIPYESPQEVVIPDGGDQMPGQAPTEMPEGFPIECPHPFEGEPAEQQKELPWKEGLPEETSWQAGSDDSDPGNPTVIIFV